MHKETLIAKTKANRLNGALTKGQKVVWFRDNMDSVQEESDESEVKKIWTKDELRELVSVYLKRNQDDVDELLEKKSNGKVLSPKEALFLQVVDTEAKEARLAGVSVPDLTNGTVVKALRAWDGDVNSITTIKMIACKPLGAPTDDTTAETQAAPETTVSEDQAIANLTGMIVG
ncbi:translation machinery-associated protein 16 [Coemansia sp. RSA 1933]|nr:translation machinery-associated protein 16 [Coemansia sp. RSA 1933]